MSSTSRSAVGYDGKVAERRLGLNVTERGRDGDRASGTTSSRSSCLTLLAAGCAPGACFEAGGADGAAVPERLAALAALGGNFVQFDQVNSLQRDQSSTASASGCQGGSSCAAAAGRAPGSAIASAGVDSTMAAICK